MARKQPVVGEEYVVRTMFGCGEGHFLATYTHYEAGEGCPHDHEPGHDNAYYHLYSRKFLVPRWRGAGPESGDLWEHLTNPENVNKWGQLPLAEETS